MQIRTSIGVGVLALVVACRPELEGSSVTLSLCVVGAGSDGPSGVAYTLVAHATPSSSNVGPLDADSACVSGGDDVSGATITFATSAMGVAASPTLATTNGDGSASTTVVVPYGTALVASASAPDGGLAELPLSGFGLVCTTASVGAGTAVAVGSGALPGIVYPVTVSVTIGTVAVRGLSIAFNQVGVAAASNAFIPGSAVTNNTGSATSFVFVPDIGSVGAEQDGRIYADIVAAGDILQLFVGPDLEGSASPECPERDFRTSEFELGTAARLTAASAAQ